MLILDSINFGNGVCYYFNDFFLCVLICLIVLELVLIFNFLKIFKI